MPNSSILPDDEAHMRAALAPCRARLGECWPNPAVGCVIVRDGRVAGRAATAIGGRPHAETQALAQAGADARGATAFVTLEPCAHQGRTPPCADALIDAGIARAVIAATDPDPRTDGAGIARLRGAGISVACGLLEREAVALNEGFIRRIRDRRPMVTLKLATTLDGRIAMRTGESRWITGEAARRFGHALRARHDAIMVGSGTVLADDPSLTCRLAGARTTGLVRIVVDTRLRIPVDAAVLAGAPAAPAWLLAGTDAADERRGALEGAGAVIVSVSRAPQGINLAAALMVLAERGITRLLVEGGGRVAASLLAADLVDRVAWFHAPAVMGADGIAAVDGLGIASMDALNRLHATGSLVLGPDRLTLLQRAL